MSHELELQLPDACQGCTKTGMEAIRCLFISRVPKKLIFRVQCGTAHYHEESLGTTGGKALGPVFKSDKPTLVNRERGRVLGTRARSGSL